MSENTIKPIRGGNVSERNPYKKRLQLAVDILGEIVLIRDIDRNKLIEILKSKYARAKTQPIRGKALPPDIYDKELTTLYVVGKYGLGIDIDYPELFKTLFEKEMMFDKAIQHLQQGEYEEARKMLITISPARVIDSNTLARMLRVAFTKTILGFMDEEEFKEILHKAKEAFPEEERTVHNFVRFYIAFRLAEQIYRGEIRDKITKEAYKQALAYKLGFPKTMPNDQYIYNIAANVFKVSKKILDKILGALKNKEQK